MDAAASARFEAFEDNHTLKSPWSMMYLPGTSQMFIKEGINTII